jgi:thiamine biosynthesis lipoprotein
MGMPISVDIPGCGDAQVFEQIWERLRRIDDNYSPYKKDSKLSRFQNGDLEEEKLSPEFKKIIQDCQAAKKETNGYFSADFAGKFDPTGYVKCWAIAEAGKIIEKKGLGTYCISAGGDILARSNSVKVWNIGIQDPENKKGILNRLAIVNGAVATSGTYERGAHIINPKTRKPPSKFLSVTVTGPEIINADIFATAVFAADDLTMIGERKDYEALAIGIDGSVNMTRGMKKLLLI